MFPQLYCEVYLLWTKCLNLVLLFFRKDSKTFQLFDVIISESFSENMPTSLIINFIIVLKKTVITVCLTLCLHLESNVQNNTLWNKRIISIEIKERLMQKENNQIIVVNSNNKFIRKFDIFFKFYHSIVSTLGHLIIIEYLMSDLILRITMFASSGTTSVTQKLYLILYVRCVFKNALLLR